MMTKKGGSALEVILVILMFGILITGGILNYKQFFKKSKSAAEEIVAFLNLVRARSIAETRYLLVRPTSSTYLQVYSVPGCSSSAVSQYPLALTLPAGTQLVFTDWEICYSSKGLSNTSGTIQVREGQQIKSIEISLGGLPKLNS